MGVGFMKKDLVANKPWGSYTTLVDEPFTKVKKIVIHPNQSPSYQYHFNREEIWVIVKGNGEVTVDGVVSTVSVGDVVTVARQAKHSIKNIGNDDLVFIEVQLGDSFEESDIVRLTDLYGRL